MAIKILSERSVENPTFVERFRREAEAIARLEHPHILPVYDSGEENGLTYLVMRYVESGTLTGRLKKPIDETEIVRLLRQVAEALAYTHRQGIIHRDIKPSNILLDPRGTALLSDFGIAKMVEATEGLTGHDIIGTATYMSPEQAQSRAVDERSDIYSLGVILYEALVGHPPFEAETPMAVLLKHINDPLPRPCSLKPEISPTIERVILKALAKNPADRYQTADEMNQAMQSALTPVEDSLTQANPKLDELKNPVGSPLLFITNWVEAYGGNQVMIRVGGVILVVVCSLFLVVMTVLDTPVRNLLNLNSGTASPTEASTFIFNAPVGAFINQSTIEELTINAGDSPEVKQQKAEQRAKLIVSIVLEYVTRMDTRLGLVDTVLQEDDTATKLAEARSTVAPSAQEILGSAYQKHVATDKINALRQQFNSYPLVVSPESLVLELVAESQVEPSKITSFYDQLAEVQSASDALLDDMALITRRDSPDEAWITYFQQRVQLAIETLQNRSQLAHLAGLSVLNDLPPAHLNVTGLAGLIHLTPRQTVKEVEVEKLYEQYLKEMEALSHRRAALLEEDQAGVEKDLSSYMGVNEDLTINPTDTWEMVVSKAISLRQLGRTDEAVAAFAKYEEMFAATDPTASQYAQTAQQFTRQIKALGLEDGAVYIFQRDANSPAAQAGLKVGDILIEFNGKPIRKSTDFQTVVQEMPLGKPIRITLLRRDAQKGFYRQIITITIQGSIGIGVMPI